MNHLNIYNISSFVDYDKQSNYPCGYFFHLLKHDGSQMPYNSLLVYFRVRVAIGGNIFFVNNLLHLLKAIIKTCQEEEIICYHCHVSYNQLIWLPVITFI